MEAWPFIDHDVIPTSFDHIIFFCKPQRQQFWTFYTPSEFHFHCFNALEVMNWSLGRAIFKYARKTYILEVLLSYVFLVTEARRDPTVTTFNRLETVIKEDVDWLSQIILPWRTTFQMCFANNVVVSLHEVKFMRRIAVYAGVFNWRCRQQNYHFRLWIKSCYHSIHPEVDQTTEQ